MLKATQKNDPELYNIVQDEMKRQQYNIEMIASESTAPLEVLELNGSIFTNKTTEGYPGKRFQAGSQIADHLEELAVDRAKRLYSAEHANVQPYSGSTANYSVYAATLTPGDTVLSMRLDQGGHLTHGSPANFLSDVYKYEFYGVHADTETIDYDALEKKAQNCHPKLIIAGASSYPRLIDYERMKEIAHSVGALLMVDMAHVAGLVAAQVIPSPVPHADFVTSSTTKTFCGSRGGLVLCKSEYAKALDKGVFPKTISSIHLATIAANTFSLGFASTETFRATMKQVVHNSIKLAEELEKYGFRIVSGGTDNHMVLADLRGKEISGLQLQNDLEYIGITVNKNVIPFDPAPPSKTSGVRIGLTSITQRGLKEPEVERIAEIINAVAEARGDKKKLEQNKDKAAELISQYPLYPFAPQQSMAGALANKDLQKNEYSEAVSS